MNEIKISVIIPCYCQQDLVIKAIDSIPKRDDIEIIVIDDGSTDNTWNNLLEYRNKHPEILNLILLYNEGNKGVAYTVNKGYDVAQGEYVVLLGSDDYFYTKDFEEFIDNELDGTDLVYFNVRINNGEIWDLNQDTKILLCGSYKFMRREFIGNTRNANRISGEDRPFYMELLTKNPTEKFTHKIIKHYNHPRYGSLTDQVRRGLINEDE